jgi:hypothetical protein
MIELPQSAANLSLRSVWKAVKNNIPEADRAMPREMKSCRGQAVSDTVMG